MKPEVIQEIKTRELKQIFVLWCYIFQQYIKAYSLSSLPSCFLTECDHPFSASLYLMYITISSIAVLERTEIQKAERDGFSQCPIGRPYHDVWESSSCRCQSTARGTAILPPGGFTCGFVIRD